MVDWEEEIPRAGRLGRRRHHITIINHLRKVCISHRIMTEA